jgi:phage shock protein E
MSWLDRFRARAPSATVSDNKDHIEMQPAEFLRIRAPDASLLDVRTAAEFEESHIASAGNVDILRDDFVEQVAALGIAADRPVYLYCRSGNRSGRAARLLRQQGYRAFNVGALDDLVAEGAELARRT